MSGCVLKIELDLRPKQTFGEAMTALPALIYRGLSKGLSETLEVGDQGVLRGLEGGLLGHWWIEEKPDA